MASRATALDSSDQLFHLSVMGKSAQTFLGKYQPVVDSDFVYATAGGDQLDLGVILFLQFGFQPGSTRFVISCGAVFYGYSHCYLPGAVCQSKLILAAFSNEHYYKNLNGNIQHKE